LIRITKELSKTSFKKRLKNITNACVKKQLMNWVPVLNKATIVLNALINFYFWVMLICALRAHDKVSLYRNFAFNKLRNLMHQKEKHKKFQNIISIFVFLSCDLRAQVNILLYFL
jgi:hypothetical protein